PPIPAGTTLNFRATGAGFGGQGGVGGSCGIPFGPTTSVVINFVAVGPTGPGDLRVTPFPSAFPLASIINYIPGDNVANGVPIAICNPATTPAPGCTSDFRIFFEASASHLVADVQGFFAAPTSPVTQNLFAVVNSNHTLARGFRATAVLDPADCGAGLGCYDVR